MSLYHELLGQAVPNLPDNLRDDVLDQMRHHVSTLDKLTAPAFRRLAVRASIETGWNGNPWTYLGKPFGVLNESERVLCRVFLLRWRDEDPDRANAAITHLNLFEDV